MSAAFLDDNEMAELTHRKQKRAQIKMLKSLGIEHKVRADGSIAVLWDHVRRVFGANEPSRKQKHVEPNWDAMKNA